MRRTDVPPTHSRWYSFNIAVSKDVDRQQDIIDWCLDLEGREGMFYVRIWSVSGMNVFIENPNHAFLFKMRWC